MKKLMVLAVSILALSFSTPVLAAASEKEPAKQDKPAVKTEASASMGKGCMMRDQMAERQKKMMDQMVLDKKITAEQAKMMQENMAAMHKDMMKECPMMGASHGMMHDKEAKGPDAHNHAAQPEGKQGEQHTHHTTPTV